MMPRILNPKLEIRNPKEIQMRKKKIKNASILSFPRRRAGTRSGVV
jgi:hypothetical protein